MRTKTQKEQAPLRVTSANNVWKTAKTSNSQRTSTLTVQGQNLCERSLLQRKLIANQGCVEFCVTRERFNATSLGESSSNGGGRLSPGRERFGTWRHTRLSANAPGLRRDGELNDTTYPLTSGLQCGPKPRKKSSSVSLESENRLQFVWKAASEQHGAGTSTCTE